MTDTQAQEQIDVQAQLKRCISRLSYVGMGLSSELDPLLRNLRGLITSDASVEQLQETIDQISKALRLTDDSSSQGHVESIRGEIEVFNLLLKGKLPSGLLKAFKKARLDDASIDAEIIANSIVFAINSYVQDLVNESPSEKKGFLSGLFGKQEKPDSAQENMRREELEISQNLRVSLQHLIGQLSVMEGYSEVGLKLTEKVNSIDKVEELADILELITGSFVEVSSLEHQQFERFLNSLNKRLDQVNGVINHTVEYASQVVDSSEELNLSLQGSVSDIKESFEDSDEKSLKSVQKILYEKLDAITEKVALFTSTQESSQSKLNDEIDIIREQLKATEDESSRLKDDLSKQRERAHTDSLTLLPNRYSYNERLTQEYNRWRRYRSPLSIVIGDIDYFKKVNDSYGHAAGDEVLRQVSQYLQASLRESDYIARFGGEEFIILLPETSLVDAAKAVNKLRQGVKDIVVRFEEHSISVAMSFGISCFDNDDTTKAVFSRADQALFRAKDKGRDQVCCQRSKSKEN